MLKYILRTALEILFIAVVFACIAIMAYQFYMFMNVPVN